MPATLHLCITMALAATAASACGARTIDDRAEGGAGGGATPATTTGGSEVPRWTEPSCDPVATIDGVRVQDVAIEVWAIVPLDDPNVLLSHIYGQLRRSTDAGCTWHPFPGEEPEFGHGYTMVIARPGGGAYAFLDERLVLIDGDVVTPLALPPVTGAAGPHRLHSFRVHPTIPERLVVWANDRLHRSDDGGHHWSPGIRPRGPTPHDLEPDARDFDRALLSDDEGVWRTADRGATWEPSIVEADGERVEQGHFTFTQTGAPAVVYAREDGAIDPTEPGHAPVGWYRSDDGGARFVQVEVGPGALPHLSDGRDLWFAQPLWDDGDFPYT